MILPVVVLAGGLGTRLLPITEKIPKSLIPVNGTPFVIHQLNLFHQNEFNHVHFCLGHLGEKIQNVIEDSTLSTIMKITYSFDGETLLGTGGSLLNALPDLPETFFVTYGDSFLDIDYKSVESRFFEYENDYYALMTVFKNLNKFDTSNVIFENNKIVLYSKKHIQKNMKYIDYGLTILRKSHFNNIKDNYKFDLSELYEELSKKGDLMGYESPDRFYEIGSHKGIEDLSKYLITK